MSGVHKSFIVVLVSALAIGWQAVPAHARNFRVSLTPNGSANNCSNCHNRASGGGPRNSFGQDVLELVSSGGREAFWSPTLAALDSDADGFTNGEELGDADGDGTVERTVNISLPGVPGSLPKTALGDCNLDTVLNGDDLSCIGDIDARDAVLGALNTLPGDLNGNGDVAFADFLVLSGNFGKDLPAYTDGNIDLAGSIDFADFLALSGNFGKSGAGALASVPEPGGGLIAAIGILLLSSRRKSRKR